VGILLAEQCCKFLQIRMLIHRVLYRHETKRAKAFVMLGLVGRSRNWKAAELLVISVTQSIPSNGCIHDKTDEISC
jgi:hypothetical protein